MPDLDQVEALTPEREALWARMQRTTFLSDAEKREAVGYGEAGKRGSGGGRFARKYREDQARDDQGRWVDEGGGAGDSDADLGIGAPQDSEDGNAPTRPRDEFDENESPDGLLQPISSRGPGRLGSPRLDAAFRDAQQQVRQTRELDPNWSPPRSFTSRDNIEGQIAHYEAVARAAQQRYGEITRDAVPGTNPSWSASRLREELRDRGFEFQGSTRTPGTMLENPRTGERVRIMERPERQPFRLESPHKFTFERYYRYRPGRGKGEGAHIPIPD